MRVIAITSCVNCPYGEVVLSEKKCEPMEVYCVLRDFKLVGSGSIIASVHEDCPLPDPELWTSTYSENKEKGEELEFEELVGRIRYVVAYGPHWCLKPGDLDKALPRRRKDDPIYDIAEGIEVGKGT